MTLHPLDVGARVQCERVDGQTLSCEVIERRNDADGSYTYYVHYDGHDRRLDEWVHASRMHPEPAEMASGAGKKSASGTPDREFGHRRATRNMRRKIDEINHVQTSAEHDEELEKEHEESTKLKNVQRIEMGRFEVDAWYFSPYPDAFAQQEKLYICEYTLKYMKKRKAYERHKASLRIRQPPGIEIYRTPAPPLHPDCVAAGLLQPQELSIFEVDGSKAKVYCQCLCLLAKLFLDHKTLYYDVDPFLFYVLCEVHDGGHSLVGYFSKEKASHEGNNIACILVLPQHQRKGYGKLLIDTAYQITIREGKVGSPEKPLSDLGQLSFRSYWTQVLLQALSAHRGNLSIGDISSMTAIKTEDIISTLQSLNLIKFWKGQHVISVSPKIVDEHLRANGRSSLRCNPQHLTWQPPPQQ